MTRLFRITVNGAARFPLDMLRHDRCWPRTSEDAANIGYTLERSNKGPLEVVLLVYSERKFYEPTAGRWSSFGWTVTNVEEVV